MAMGYRERVFWQDTVEMPTASPQPLPESVDVAVIGAGFTGLSAARTLARKGARVAVLEAETIAWGASSRNGGMVLTGLKLPVETLVQRYGREAAQRMYAASLASIDCVEQIIAEEQIACDFARCGHLEVACKPAHFEAFARSAEVIAREFNRRLRVVPRQHLPTEVGSHIYYGGLVDEASAGLNPARYVAGLAGAAQKAGALLFDHARVMAIDRASRNGGPAFRLTSARGNVAARDIFVATSGYTGAVTPALRKKVVPIGSFIIVTDPLPDALACELSPRNRMIFDSKNFLYYYRLTPDNRMLFGGRAAFFPETSSTIRRSADILRQGMVGVYPQLKQASVACAWGGTLDFCFDIMPHAGCSDGIYYALGYAGHGVAMATYLGAKMAQRIAGGPDENPFNGIPFPGAPLGLYNGVPWFLPFAGLYYKLADWLS
jgi:glycine/D-amino acid oxidase-like deaminating enzyme